jgi:hypothetical protein
MAVWSTQTLTEMSTRNISWGVKTAGAKVYDLTTFMWRLEIWDPQPPGSVRACPGLYWDCFIVVIIPKVTTIGSDSFSLP